MLPKKVELFLLCDRETRKLFLIKKKKKRRKAKNRKRERDTEIEMMMSCGRGKQLQSASKGINRHVALHRTFLCKNKIWFLSYVGRDLGNTSTVW